MIIGGIDFSVYHDYKVVSIAYATKHIAYIIDKIIYLSPENYSEYIKARKWLEVKNKFDQDLLDLLK